MGQHFDFLCKFAENKPIPRIKKLVMDSRLFEIKKTHDKTDFNDEETKLLGEDFHLPFQTICVEDADSCVLIHDKMKNNHGLKCNREVIIGCRITRSLELMSFIVGGTIGEIRILSSRDIWYGAEDESLYACNFTGEIWTDIFNWSILKDRPEVLGIVTSTIRDHLTNAIREILFTNSPSRFILENAPLRIRNNATKLQRTHERPLYTLLHPSNIRKKMHLPELTNLEKQRYAPHERRGHFRYLKDKRYTHNPDGTPRKIWIAATWIGPAENIIGRRRYKVILD